jgi:hypothetical protein
VRRRGVPGGTPRHSWDKAEPAYGPAASRPHSTRSPWGGASAGLEQEYEFLSTSSTSVSRPWEYRKLPKLSSVPAGMAAWLIVTAGPCGVTTWWKPAGTGSEKQTLPVVTIAGIPSCCRSFCRVLGCRSTCELIVRVAVPLACEGHGADRARAAGRGRAENPGQAQAEHNCRSGRGGGDARGELPLIPSGPVIAAEQPLARLPRVGDLGRGPGEHAAQFVLKFFGGHQAIPFTLAER